MFSTGNNKSITAVITTALLIALHLPAREARASGGAAAAKGTPPIAADKSAEPPPGANAPANGAIKEMLVVGFSLSGNDPWKKKSISDLDLLVSETGQRYFPLFRLLKEFEIDRTTQGSIVKFLPEGMPLTTLDISFKSLEVDGVKTTIELIPAKSETTGENDVYLDPQTISGIFGIELTWNEGNYELVGTTKRKLKIWKTNSRSAHEIQIQDVPANLPEAHPQATPNRFGLDFLELALRSNLIADDNLKQRQGRIDNLQQILWGSFLGGAYKLNVSERDVQFSSKERQPTGTSLFMLSKGEWNKRYQSTEVSVGDSAFGLSDLAFPGVRVAGVRINGLAGYSDAESALDRSSRGLRNYFVQPQVFAGSAPRGSQVELKINGRIFDTQEAVPSLDSEVGSGDYRFEDVILPPGSLNEVLITITDSNGIKTYLKKELLGSSLFQAPGKIAYLASAGIGRDLRTWTCRGLFAGGRVLYAFNDHLSAGYTLGFQERIFDQTAAQYLSFQQRRFPDSSLHMGGQFIWRPSNFLILGGESAFSNGSAGESSGSYNDAAFKADASIFPTSSSSLSGQFFRYGANFFNGQNIELHDRQGYLLRGKWRLSPEWSLTGLYAKIGNNLDRAQPETLDLGFQNLELSSSVIPHATVSFSANRSAPNWESPGALYILKLYAMVMPDVTISGAVAVGDSLSLSDHSDFANGINIAGLATEEPSSVLSLAVTANQWNELGVTFAKSAGQEKVLGAYKCRSRGNSLRLKTELGYDFSSRSSIIKNRTEYLLDNMGDKSLELVTDYENKNLSMVVSFNYRGLFDFRDRFPSALQSRYIQPDNGGVSGRVFIDYNANSDRDPGEPGLENVKVIMNGNSCLTDKNGHFKLPNAGEISDAKVFIDMSTVPAIYSPTHALQKVHIVPGIQTEVNLGVTPLISVAGLVLAETEAHATKPLYGVRVFVTRPNDAKVVAESSTAGDGSYYLGDLRPGSYQLQVDPGFLQKSIVAEGTLREMVIAPATEPQEITITAFKFSYKKDAAQPAAGTGPAAQKSGTGFSQSQNRFIGDAIAGAGSHL